MTLYALMFHRAVAGRHGNFPEMLDRHFEYVAKSTHCVLPGDELDPERINVCLTFDDAYYDFYAVAFPLLEKHGLKAMLAVSPGLISEGTISTPADRLALSAYDAFAYPEKGGLCTWKELGNLAGSGRIAFASHGRTHVRLDNSRADLEREIATSGVLIRHRLGVWVESFVFPFGRFNARSCDVAHRFYPYLWRIGQGGNSGWNEPLLYRICADEMEAPDALFTQTRRLNYRINALWNKVRGR